MTINLNVPDIHELKPRITVFGVGGAGGNAVNNMITAGLQGVDFVVANTDAQALTMSKAQRIVQMGTQVTQGLGAGSQPDVGAAAAEEVIDELRDHLTGANMVFVTAGMGGGTGEATGEKRALTAAEAAIANPLIDDSSMKGARGLLISITGGKDLTLFEVDEAATRIREEVDQDANIIVGATFDESLDGVIRVSVVATGIEQAAIARAVTASSAPSTPTAPVAAPSNAAASSESRLADLTARLRADNQRLAERAAKLEAQPVPATAPQQPRPNANVERAALAAIAAAVSPETPAAAAQPVSYGDVPVRPLAQKPS